MSVCYESELGGLGLSPAGGTEYLRNFFDQTFLRIYKKRGKTLPAKREERVGVKLHRKIGIALLMVDNPPLNVLTRRMKEELRKKLEEILADESIRAIVIAGAGRRAFSVGSDVNELVKTVRESSWRERAEHEHEVYSFIESSPKPTIAAIQGYALGGGLELALSCDLRVAGEDAQIGFPEVKLGVFPAGGGTERLPCLVGKSKALEIMLMGEPVSAREAKEIGLVNYVVPAGIALDFSVEIAKRIAGYSAPAVRAIKEVVNHGLGVGFKEAKEFSIEKLGEVFRSEDFKEGLNAFLEKREPRFRHR